MASILVAYATSEGQTARVADRIVATLEGEGHEATALNLNEGGDTIDLPEYDAALVGASIHAGSHQPVVREFATDYSDDLAEMPTGFFQVSLSSVTEEGEEQAAGYVEAFVADTGWDPDRIGLFGGALRYSEMGFIKRTFIKQIVKRTMPETPTDSDGEFTDWEEVEAFARDFGGFVTGRRSDEETVTS